MIKNFQINTILHDVQCVYEYFQASMFKSVGFRIRFFFLFCEHDLDGFPYLDSYKSYDN